MMELMFTALAVGTTKFIGDLIIFNESYGRYNFEIANIKTDIKYNAKLDLSRKNFHATIDVDINF